MRHDLRHFISGRDTCYGSRGSDRSAFESETCLAIRVSAERKHSVVSLISLILQLLQNAWLQEQCRTG